MNLSGRFIFKIMAAKASKKKKKSMSQKVKVESREKKL